MVEPSGRPKIFVVGGPSHRGEYEPHQAQKPFGSSLTLIKYSSVWVMLKLVELILMMARVHLNKKWLAESLVWICDFVLLEFLLSFSFWTRE